MVVGIGFEYEIAVGATGVLVEILGAQAGRHNPFFAEMNIVIGIQGEGFEDFGLLGIVALAVDGVHAWLRANAAIHRVVHIDGVVVGGALVDFAQQAVVVHGFEAEAEFVPYAAGMHVAFEA